MPLLRTSARGLADLSTDGRVGAVLAEQMSFQMKRRASAAEMRSWDSSLRVLADDLTHAGLDQVEVLLEYQLPLSSKRIDVVLAGRHPRRDAPSYVVVELKQWTEATLFEDDAELVVQPTYGPRPILNPIAQVRAYGEYLLDFTTVLHGTTDVLAGAAYLPNASTARVGELFNYPQDELGRLFTGENRGEWLDFLRSRLAPTDGSVYADRLLHSAIAPSKQLMAVAAEEIRRREQFVLLDEQRVAFDLVMHQVEKARAGDHKSVVVVSGGPGSGKSVIALSLLGELNRRGRSAIHATGSRSFTQTLRKVAGKGSRQVQSLFKYFNSFMDADKNGFDVLIADEAHRLRETSANRWTKAEHRTGKAQVDELIDAARVPVFLLDQNQVVRPGELGTVEDIEQAARARGLEVHHVDLSAQYRCGGSEVYIDWVERLLGLRPGGPVPWDGDPNFEVRVVESPSAMETALETKLAEHYGARMAAGYCWPWSDPRKDGSLVPDVQIGDWARPWNLKDERSVGGAPPAALWASEPAGFGQVGCVYTAQGFEYDWNGVLLGPDLVWRTDHWVAVRSANRDPDFRNTKRVSVQEFDGLVRNVYKVLLSRGMRGTLLHSTDRETHAFLRSLIATP
ncbi:MAG: ATP-binding protein [Streptosporangiaceae bacterium]|nr:ATP-binding protein [Streptosporangiaceae bacterium]